MMGRLRNKMTSRWFVVLVLISWAGSARAEQVAFTNLQQAVDFMAGALETTNFVRIANACMDAGQKPSDGVLKELQALDRQKPFRHLYAGRSFPTNEPTFKLGGHMSELGCTHVDFVRTNGLWRLKAIWMCR